MKKSVIQYIRKSLIKIHNYSFNKIFELFINSIKTAANIN
jgi:hypothetical protein